ncbi:hypothetical protein M409DRAFT_64449 [Zasmidium cellare ATCC 36951]|uniref:Methyltransferase domain-containing protein n=1 Tax=Zasmidium cellare ATCC 36951 TaxID=1080233 RepID=A0A6A6CTP1_ZASCE|nr:uncharacterized protein M409DRAFT_64449 [Zasmidium cellare ATCC 36951]KAF2170083.1 hypothetical protein M409DRAFT_64449 [Zasmidium cellare ATCC 36951]
MYTLQAKPVQLSTAPRAAHATTMSRLVPIAALLRPDAVEKFKVDDYTYYNFRNETYHFPAQDIEYERLDIMHQLIYDIALNGQLHLAHLRASPGRILDIGFGDGFWMTEMQQQYPEAEVIGIDLDSAVTSTPGSRPMFRSPVDFNAPQWPVEDSSVDLVHVAQLLGCVPDWLQFYRKAYRCLRPGIGHLEHVEIDWAHRTTDPQFPAEAADLYNWWHWIRQASELAGKSLACRDDTEDLLEEAGFRDVSHRRIRVPVFWTGKRDRKDIDLAHGYQTAMGPKNSQSFHGFSMLLFTRYLHWTPQQVRDLCDRVLKIIEYRQSCPQLHQLYVNLHIWTARRPQT